MRPAHERERAVGMAWYASDTDGMGGRIRQQHEDFVVEECDELTLEPLDADPGDYPHLIVRVTLTGWDTFDFVHTLGNRIGVHSEAIGWAGTKDKRAVTTQSISVQGIEPADLPDVEHARIEPIGRFGRALFFGDLVGNAFRIRIRDADAPERREPIADELEALGDGRLAVPNFFGQQRFGSIRPITHRVGEAIVRGDWAGATDAYLAASSPAEPARTRAFREEAADSDDWANLLDRVPGQLQYERTILGGLADGESHRAALDRLPRRLRQLFVHAFQSYLFNRIVSERLDREIPLAEPVEGDVVCFARETDALGLVPDPDRAQRVDERRLRPVSRHVAAGRAFVTAPLLGHEVTPGTGVPGEIAREVLAEHDVTPADFELPEPYDAGGTRRAALVHPSVRWEVDPLTTAFELPSGSYATVVLREYLKVDPIHLG